MLAIDSSLHFLWGSKLQLQVHDLEQWTLDVKILDLEIFEEMDVKIGAERNPWFCLSALKLVRNDNLKLVEFVLHTPSVVLSKIR